MQSSSTSANHNEPEGDDEFRKLAESAGSLVCPMCESQRLRTRHCKRLCPGCGYVESCEDNFLPNQANPGCTAE